MSTYSFSWAPKAGGGGDGGDPSRQVKNLGGDVLPGSRMKWPKSGAFADYLWVF